MSKRKLFARMLLIPVVAVSIAICGHAWHLVRPHYRNRTMPQWLELFRTNTGPGNNVLEIIRIENDQGDQTLACELPMSYDLVKPYGLFSNVGFALSVNGKRDLASVFRASNGNIILTRPIAVLSPGLNHLQARFTMQNDGYRGFMRADGPVADFVITTNICVIDWDDISAGPNYMGGFDLHAKLATNDANYNIELLDANEHHLKTILGHTANGDLREHWDYINDAGFVFTDNVLKMVYHISISNYPTAIVTQYYEIKAQR